MFGGKARALFLDDAPEHRRRFETANHDELTQDKLHGIGQAA